MLKSFKVEKRGDSEKGTKLQKRRRKGMRGKSVEEWKEIKREKRWARGKG